MPQKTKVIIIDDEKLAREIIKKYLDHHPGIEIAAECANGFEGIKKINEFKPEIIFLDIQMPKLNGFEMLELISDTENSPAIIFTTAYDQYAIKAFEVSAVDYLLKPFSEERFNEALNKALISLNDKSKAEKNLKSLINHNPQLEKYLERIVVKEGTKINIIPVEQIKWIEAQDDYIMINSYSGKYLKKKTMKFLEENLDPKNFIRIHRSYIAAVKEIEKIELFEKESYQIKIKNENKFLPVSKNGYEKLKEMLK